MDELENIRLSEISQRQILYDITYTGNQKKKRNKHNQTEVVIDTKNKQVTARGERDGRKREIDEGGQEEQTFSCKINESQVQKVQCGEYSQQLCLIFAW